METKSTIGQTKAKLPNPLEDIKVEVLETVLRFLLFEDRNLKDNKALYIYATQTGLYMFNYTVHI